MFLIACFGSSNGSREDSDLSEQGGQICEVDGGVGDSPSITKCECVWGKTDVVEPSTAQLRSTYS